LKVLIADDHALVRVGLVEMLSNWRSDLAIQEAADADAAMQLISADSELDLILLDLFMPGAHGFDLLRRVREAASSVPVLVLSASESSSDARTALAQGASGFLCKSAPWDLMQSVLDLILAGGTYVPDSILRRDNAASRDVPAGRRNVAGLTNRQQEVLALIGRGWSNKQIARGLDLSENTVKVHVAGLLRQLNVANRTEAVIRARELGFPFDGEE
jgi:DNA-binding NarL/FixJ family response regulator